MYHLTERMKQHLRKNLRTCRSIFQGNRCSGWEPEELFVRAIKSDTTAQRHLCRKEAGHDQDADIQLRANGEEHPIRIKSCRSKEAGKWNAKCRFCQVIGSVDLMKTLEKSQSF